MRQNDRSTLYVDFLHLESQDYLLADAIKQNHYRYESYLRKAIQNFVRKVDPAFVQEEVSDRLPGVCQSLMTYHFFSRFSGWRP